jgi:Flp pilus assembly protein TadB
MVFRLFLGGFLFDWTSRCRARNCGLGVKKTAIVIFVIFVIVLVFVFVLVPVFVIVVSLVFVLVLVVFLAFVFFLRMKPKICYLKINVSCEASVNFHNIAQNATPATQFARCDHLTQP